MTVKTTALALPEESKNAPALPRTKAFARAAIAKALHGNELVDMQQAFNCLHKRFPQARPEELHALAVYAANVPGTELPASELPSNQFLAALRAKEVLAQIGAYEVPLNSRATGLVNEVDAHLVQQGRAIPISSADFFGTLLTGKKVASIVVVNKELIARSPLAEQGLQSALFQGALKSSDATFLSAAVDTTPAVVTGVTSVFQAQLAIDSLTAAFDDENSDLSRVTIVMHPTLALKMLGLRTNLDVSAFPEIATGKLRGLPLLTSRGCPRNQVIAIDSGKVVAAFGGVTLDTSQQATLEMSDSPAAKTGYGEDDVTAQAAKRVPIFQIDGVAIRVIREFDFRFTDEGAVAWLDNFAPVNSETSA